MDRITKKVAGERLKPEEFRPEATIDGNDAIVKLQRTKGVPSADDVALRQAGGSPTSPSNPKRKRSDDSARRTAKAVHTVVKFLKAYKADDKRSSKRVTETRFYDKCLKLADLKTVPLPAPEVLGNKDVIKTH